MTTNEHIGPAPPTTRLRAKAMALAILLAALVALFALASPARATDFTVNSTGDAVDATPGNGTCDTAANECTLRAAIMEVNNTTEDNTIDFTVDTVTLSITGPNEDIAFTGDLDLFQNVEIDGGDGGVVINTSPSFDDRVFDTSLDFTGGMTNLAVRGGKLSPTNDHALGGGIFNRGTLTLSESTVSGNTASSSVGFDALGGGVFNNTNSTLTLTNSTVSGNTSSGSFDASGGGVRNIGTLAITNYTVSGNTASSSGTFHAYGGGIFNSGPMTITNSTVSGNTASNNSGTSYGGGIRASVIHTDTLRNTIVANNTAANDGPDAFGTFISEGDNLIEDPSDSTGFGSADIIGVDPNLGNLANNGGLTRTHALLSGSPAIDAGDNAGCSATDQRGINRPVDGDADGVATCDIGAFERRTTADLSLVKKANRSAVQIGHNLVYTLTARNNGPDPTSGVVVTDTLPSGVSLLSAPGCVNSSGTVSCHLGRMTDGESKTRKITVRVEEAGTLANTASVEGGGRDPNSANDSDGATTTVTNPAGCTIFGTPGNDVLNGTPRRDVICGFGGNDRIDGRGGDDVIRGGAGDDILIGGPGNDKLFGEGGNDRLNVRDGVRGNDLAHGGVGVDICVRDQRDRARSCQ